MKDLLDWLLPLAGGSVVAVLAIVGCAWGVKRVTEWAASDALAKGLADHNAKIDERLAAQQRAHESKLAALRSELRALESEAADLRAHSLGLEAERRRDFETRRAEVCGELFGELARMAYTVRVIQQAGPGGPTVSHGGIRAELLELLGAAERASLYLSAETADKSPSWWAWSGRLRRLRRV